MSSNLRLSLRNAIFALALLAIFGTCALIGGLYLLFSRVEAAYGPARPGLELVERIYLSAQLYTHNSVLTAPGDPEGAPQDFEVELGASPPDIAGDLRGKGLILDEGSFIAYLRYAGLDTTIQAGSYRLSRAQTPLEIARALQDATPKEVDFSVLPGWRIEEIAGVLPTSGLEFSPEAFLTAARILPAGIPFLEEAPAGASLEGFLAPGSYQLPRETHLEDFLRILLTGFGSQLTPELSSGLERQGLTLFQAVTLASIVQREAVVANEMPTIASVFFNRLAIGIPLEADSTVQYALGYNDRQNTWWTNPLSSQDLQTDSPYNTYRYAGLPPAPIANPGAEALRAVVFPAQTPYYYFRAACDGSGRHLFAITFEEHLQNACQP
jgi:UPF0755 protein